jgi:hypothetical protein
MIDNGMMLLQNCVDLLKMIPGSYSETCPTSSYGGNEGIDIKIEVTDIQEEEEPEPVTFPVIKSENEVSCTSVCTLLGTYHKYLLT